MIRGVQNLALKTPIGNQKRSNYAKSRAKYSSELFNVTTRDATPFPAYTESPASAKMIASPVFFGTEWPCRHSGLPSRMCARTFPCSGRGSCSLRTPRPRELAGASFFLELQDAIEHVWEEWTPTADVRGMMHFGDRSQPLSALPGQRANSARPDPRRECPSGTAAWRTRAGHQSPRAGVASRSRNRGTARIRPPPGAAPFKRFCGDTPAIPCLLPTA